MNKNNEVEKFKRLLKLRTIFKQINQISWNITALEKRYPLDVISNSEIDGLLQSYKEYAHDVSSLNDELKGELSGKRQNNQ